MSTVFASAVPAAPRALLSVRHLKVEVDAGGWLPWKRARIAVIEDLHFDLRAGEAIGIVGEAGCGKSVLAAALAGARRCAAGSIRCEGAELAAPGRAGEAALRRAIQHFESPSLSELKASRRAGEVIAARLRELEPGLEPAARKARAATALAEFGFPPSAAAKKLKTFGAGERARLALARALASGPRVLLLEVPLTVSGAGLSIAERETFLAQVGQIVQARKLGVIVFARQHADLPVWCTRWLTMCFGRIMEQAPAEMLREAPRHPYTRALWWSPPNANASPPHAAMAPVAQVAPMGCAFHPRCPLAESLCVRSVPTLRRVAPEHYAACHFLA